MSFIPSTHQFRSPQYRPTPRFGAAISEPKLTLAQMQTRGASQVTQAGDLSPGERLACQIHNAKAFRMFFPMVSGFMLGLCGLMAGMNQMDAFREQQKLTALEANPDSSPESIQAVKNAFQEGQRGTRVALFYMSPVFLLIGLIGGAISHRDVRKLQQQAKAFNAGELTIKAQSDPAVQEVCSRLSQRIDQACEIYAHQFHTLYREKPAARNHLDKVFGGPDSLPNASDLRKLFEYIAYQKVVNEHRLTGWQGPPPITEKQHLETLYTLLRTGLVVGDPFQFLVDNPDSPFKQGFNEELLSQVMLAELEVQQETRQLTQLVEKKQDIEKHLAFAQKALTVASLSVVDRKEEIQQIETALAVFSQYQQKIEAVLSQPLTKEMTRPQCHETLLAGVDQSMQETLLYLKSTLLVHREEQAFQTSVQNALKS